MALVVAMAAAFARAQFIEYAGEWTGPAEDPFHAISAIAVLPSGDVWVAELSPSRVRLFDAKGSLRREMTIKADALAINPAAGRVYACDSAADRIRCYDTAGALLFEWGSDEGDAALEGPDALAASAATGEVAVLCSGSSLVRIYDSKGVFLRAWSALDPTWSTRTLTPTTVAMDAETGDVALGFVNDYPVQIFTSAGHRLEEWARSASDPPLPYVAQRICMDRSGRIYVASLRGDGIHRLVRDRFDAQWFQTIPGMEEDGAHISAIATDGERMLYAVTDGGETIHRFRLSDTRSVAAHFTGATLDRRSQKRKSMDWDLDIRNTGAVRDSYTVRISAHPRRLVDAVFAAVDSRRKLPLPPSGRLRLGLVPAGGLREIALRSRVSYPVKAVRFRVKVRSDSDSSVAAGDRRAIRFFRRAAEE